MSFDLAAFNRCVNSRIERFKGTCYRAANWTCVGRSVGRGTKSQTHDQTSIKELWVYPLVQRLLDKLTS